MNDINPIELTDATYAAAVKDNHVLIVDFWAPWCGPCRTLTPVIADLAGEYAGKATFGKVNVDDNQQAAGELGVMSIPTLVFYRNGREVDRTVGAAGKATLKEKVDALLDG